jgi:hypothetical protein
VAQPPVDRFPIWGVCISFAAPSAPNTESHTLDVAIMQNDGDCLTPSSPCTSTNKNSFPSAWAHGVNSVAKLRVAIGQANITSIECDVMMSRDDDHDKDDPNTDNLIVPILSHPPHRTSDLTLEGMLLAVTEKEETATTTLGRNRRNLIKHLKLDFKELRALAPSLDLLHQWDIGNAFQKCIVLNADILPGPGRRDPSLVVVPADEFLSTCLGFVERDRSLHPDRALQFIFSLGYQCDWASDDNEGYLGSDAAAMKELVEKYHLVPSKDRSGADDEGGIVPMIILALNARLLAKNLSTFDSFLMEYVSVRILAWTGSGEPPIPLAEVEKIRNYFVMKGMSGRIEFDCCIHDDE